MQIRLHFYSYFKDLTGCSQSVFTVEPGTSIAALLARARDEFPKLQPMRNSTLVAVGVEYQLGDYILQEDDEVSLFPPVQGG